MGLLPSENAKQAKLAARLVVEALMSSALPFLPSASPPPAPLSSISASTQQATYFVSSY